LRRERLTRGGRQPFGRRGRSSGGRLFFGSVGGDDHVLDAVISLLREDAAGGELVLGGVRTTVDDALGVGVADAGQGFELVG
jgi:hypothetical protein